ncbi:MAG: D-alanine--poly(phosphoribitol) ligase, partial [Erysipelotrichaceae bacterium]|nr:D-alanine--poly(phosphoribitol) ligase [Erysipelotrichaceae bacterium]
MLDKILYSGKDRIVYSTKNGELRYQELYDRAKRYGELLKRQGDSPVIILGHKDIDTFVTIFACLYAGRAYIPLDLWIPKERIAKIIACSEASLVITHEHFEFENITVTNLRDLEKYNEYPIQDIHNDIAYIIFTSGSTGQPKGVPITYSNLLHFIKWINSVKPLSDYQNITVLNQASFSFDLSVADIFYTVSNGHTLVALEKELQDDYSQIFDTIAKNNVNVLVVTPTFLKLCLVNREFTQDNYPSIMCIYCCGEQLEVSTAKKIYSAFPDCKLINAYGPT